MRALKSAAATIAWFTMQVLGDLCSLPMVIVSMLMDAASND